MPGEERDTGLHQLIESVDDTSPAVNEAAIGDGYTVDTYRESDPIPSELEGIMPGDTIAIGEETYRVKATNKRCNYGQEGLCELSIKGEYPDGIERLYRLYIDLDPFLVRLVGGGVYKISREEVSRVP